MSVVIHHGTAPAPAAPDEHLDPVQAELARLTRKSPTSHYKPDDPDLERAKATQVAQHQAKIDDLASSFLGDPGTAIPEATEEAEPLKLGEVSFLIPLVESLDWYRRVVDGPWKLPLQVSGFDLKTHHAVFSLELKVEVDMTGLTLEETNTRVQAMFKQAILDCAEPKDTAHDEATAGS